MWKDVCYCDLYEVNESGLVRRKSNHHVLKGCLASGYKSVKLTFPDGHQQRFYVHRLVAIHFIENDSPTIKTFVNHKDGNKLNNKVENLEWVSPREISFENFRKSKKKAISQSIPVIQLLDGCEIARFASIKKASKATGISVVQIARCIHGEITHTGAYTWTKQ